MKKLVVLVSLVLLLVCGCYESHKPVVWVLCGTSDVATEQSEYIGRVGMLNENIEIGIQADWYGSEGQSYGAYGLMHLEGDISSLLGRPYFGIQASMTTNDEDQGGAYGPILGTVYYDVFVVEAWYRDYVGKLGQEMTGGDEFKVFMGFRYPF